MEEEVGRHQLVVLAAVVVAAGCAGTPAQPASTPAAPPVSAAASDTELTAAEALAAAHAQVRVSGLDERQFQPEHYWELMTPILEAAPDRFKVAEIGRSIEDRPIRRIDFGRGETTALLWSQMHGNESTASRTLMDLIAYFESHPDDPRVARIERELHVTFVPVLNPDGAARFVRHNAVGIDVNRDAKQLATPEARALKAVRDELDARWGFNLHDQNVRTRLGSTGRDVRIALLAPPPDHGATSPANAAARQMCSYLAETLEPIVGDQIARYNESFNPRAFGDLMTRWGTSVVLIESGGELADPHKERLRTANFVAIISALDAIATGRWEHSSPTRYLNLPLNAPWVYDLLVRGASIALPGREPVRADFAVNFDDTLAETGGSVAEVGDLEEVPSLREIDATGLYFVPDPRSLGPELGPYLRIGADARGVISRDPEGRDVVHRLGGSY
ncbi:MAG: peptidase M14 [Acidobacteria bacterium]|nr:peptidase M14 [Acidobacteriota bacterium]